MKVLGIYGSPRKEGNTDLLLDAVLDGAQSAGAEIFRVFARDLKISGCIECGGCDETGECVLEDDMDQVYPLLQEADAIVMSAPVFFYGVPARLKAVIDRAQALWSKRVLEIPPERRRVLDRGKGYAVSVGATKGKRLFEGIQLTARYFYDALGMRYEGGLFLDGVEGKGDITKIPDALDRARDLGGKIVQAP